MSNKKNYKRKVMEKKQQNDKQVTSDDIKKLKEHFDKVYGRKK